MTRTAAVSSFHPNWLSRRATRRAQPSATDDPHTPRVNVLFLGVSALVALGAACSYCGTAQGAPQLTVLFSFKNTRGTYPYAGLIANSAGDLYGTTSEGGAYDKGVVFELSPPEAGKTAWKETVIFSFDKTDGANPEASLITDGAGNLYGTTYAGGAHHRGVVFELSPPTAGSTAWTETVLWSFKDKQTSGAYPGAGLLADGAGNLYGTTSEGGAYGDGEVFQLSPPVAGGIAWTEKVLLSFNGGNGWRPEASLIADAAGNLYGTTYYGGSGNYGVVFELSPPPAGKKAWTETVLHYFNGTDGERPVGGLTADSAGNLYGTTKSGGPNTDCLAGTTCGVVFELSPPGVGQTTWTGTVIQPFNFTNGDGPSGNLIADRAGNLYGTTVNGGNEWGLVYELSPLGQGGWAETVLQVFNGTNGGSPLAGLVADGAGNLYGTTWLGGAHEAGVVFNITP